MAAIRKYVVGKAPTPALRQQVEDAFANAEASGLGLLLNERIVNMPPELAPSIHVSSACVHPPACIDSRGWGLPAVAGTHHRSLIS